MYFEELIQMLIPIPKNQKAKKISKPNNCMKFVRTTLQQPEISLKFGLSVYKHILHSYISYKSRCNWKQMWANA